MAAIDENGRPVLTCGNALGSDTIESRYRRASGPFLIKEELVRLDGKLMSKQEAFYRLRTSLWHPWYWL